MPTPRSTAGDYDVANNELTAAIEVTDRNVAMIVSAYDRDQYSESDSSSTRVVLTNPLAGSFVRHTTYEAHDQGWSAWISRPQDSLPDGRITLRHSTGGVPLPMVSVSASDLGDYDGMCYYGYLAGGETVVYCSGYGATDLFVYRSAGIATYTGHRTGSGAYAGSSSWVTVEETGGPRVAMGSDYSAELRHEAGGAVFGGSLSVALQEVTWEQSVPWSCYRGWDFATFATTDCFSYWYRNTTRSGDRYEY
jgi:hypothetical protein